MDKETKREKSKEYARIKRISRETAGRCYRCGGETDGVHKSCDACREYIREASRKFKADHPEKRYEYSKDVPVEVEKPKRKPKYEMSEIIRMTKERGVSYGILVAELEMAQ
jgi:hypothetical protein